MTVLKFTEDDFSSSLRLESMWSNLINTGHTTNLVINTDLDDADIRSLLIRGKRLKSGEYRIRFKYLFHGGARENRVENLMELKFRREGSDIHIAEMYIDGTAIDINAENFFKFSGAFETFSEFINERGEWINPIEVLLDNDLKINRIGQRPLPGMYANGDLRSNDSSVIYDKKPVLPALFLPGVLGIGQDAYEGQTKKKRRLSLRTKNEGAPTQNTLSFEYIQGETQHTYHLIGTVSKRKSDSYEDEVLYEIKTEPSKNDPTFAKIKKLKFLGQKINLKDEQAVARILKIIRNTNRMIAAGDYAVTEDLKKRPHERRYALPTELALHTDAYEHLNQTVKIPKSGIMSFTTIGGNNTQKYLSDSDQYIGANQYVIAHEYNDEAGEKKTDAVMIDAGILFHDLFDGTFFNAARYLHHKHDKHHAPKTPINAILISHKHKDHLGGLAYLVKAGYQLPPLIMDGFSYHQLKRDMSELDIDKVVREEILSLCYVVNPFKDINPSDPTKRKITKIGGQKIQQWTEVYPGKSLGQYEYAPRLKIGEHMELSLCYAPHSTPVFVADIITPAGIHRHTSDYKNDETVNYAFANVEAWARRVKATSLSSDSTGANKEGSNPTEADVRESIQAYLNTYPDDRFIFPMLGSNIARLTSLITAMGESDTKRKTLIIDGKAVTDLVRDADKVSDFRKWAKRTYGIDILFSTQKKKVAAFLNDPARKSEYGLLVTGTQDEQFSSLNRAVRDALPLHRYSIADDDTILFLQGYIPTADNKFKRLDIKQFVESFHGARVVLPEILEEEAIQLVHSSGHRNAGDCREIIEWSGNPVVMPVHGGPEQLEAHAEIARKAGADVIIPKHSRSYSISERNGVSPYEIVPSEMIGITLHTPSPEKFYLKGRYVASVLKLKPELESPAISLLDEWENALRTKAGMTSEFQLANTLPVSLSRTFNAESRNGFLTQKMPFGIDKYKGDVFREKNIYAIGGFDTETGGLNSMDHLIREFALTLQNTNGHTIDSVQLFQEIPLYRAPGVEALLVTNTDPYDLNSGMPSHEFVQQMEEAIKTVKTHSHLIAQKQETPEKVSKNTIKGLLVAHNTPFDSRFIKAEMRRNLIRDTRPHETRGLISLDTRAISRALHAYKPKGYKVNRKSDTKFYDHSLEALAKANGVDYDSQQAHGGQYDTTLCLDLFWKQREVAPKIVDQMIINADKSTGHLLNDMLGIDTGFDGPKPIFSYVSPAASRPKPQMGTLIGTLDSDRYVVVFNLKYDPQDYLNLSVSEITELMADRNSDVFEIIDLRAQPIVMPARYGLRVKANGTTPKETLDRRAGIIKRHLNYVDSKNEWQTIARKIDTAWQNDRERIYSTYRSHISEDLTSVLDQPASIIFKDAPTPDKAAIELLRTQSNISFDLKNRYIYEHVRDYVKAVRQYDYDAAALHYKALMRRKNDIASMRDAINNVHFDICPQDLSHEDHTRIKAMREVMAAQRVRSMMLSIKQIETNQAIYQKYVGDDGKKKKLFNTIKRWIKQHETSLDLSEDAKAMLIPWRDLSRPNLDHYGSTEPIAALA